MGGINTWLRKTKIGLLQEAQNYSTSHPEQTAQTGGIKRTRMTFASHPREFFSHVAVDLAGPPPPQRIFLPVLELETATPRAASHAGLPGSDRLSEVQPGLWMHGSSGPVTAPVRESGINGV